MRRQKEALNRLNWAVLIERMDTNCFTGEGAILHQNLSRLAGRLCSKLALSSLNGDAPEKQQVSASQACTNRGQPVSPNGSVSISHSGDLVMAAAARVPIGIDIQYQRSFGEAALDYVFTPREQQVFNCHELTQVWCVKEAYLKASGRGLIPYAVHLEVERQGRAWLVTEQRGADLQQSLGCQMVECVWFNRKQYALAICSIAEKV
jgi:phosphopantetheinyl transferase